MPGLARLLFQILLILATIRVVGAVFRRIGQPQVVGEMVAGVLLGPSVLGAISPKLCNAIFPDSSLPLLGSLSQVGLILYLFLIGLKHDPELLKGRGPTAVISSHASILVPFLFGVVLALFLYPRLSDDSVTFTQFALFMGTAMSITAFPVLARILAERGLLDTTVGSAAIVCAAVDDVTGWLIVAGVLLLSHAAGSHLPIWIAVPATVVYAIAMLKFVPALLRPIAKVFEARGELTHDLLALVLLFAFASACATERLGIHPLFGAYIAGIAMPKNSNFVRAVVGKVEDLTVVLIVPLFFAFSGLKTHLGALFSGPEMWFYFVAIVIVAIAGKLGGAMLASRATGVTWREATALGVLINTRGLVELVVLNIGLDAGIISSQLFTIMVLMGIITTLMTTPILTWIYPPHLRRSSSRSIDRPPADDSLPRGAGPSPGNAASAGA